MKVGLDVTPLLGPRTGVGTYTAELIRALTELSPPPRLVATAFTARGQGGLAGQLPPQVRVRGIRLPARFLRTSWQSLPFPPAEALVGPVDVFHGTNFVVPPTLRARPVVTVHDLSYLTYPHTVAAASLAYARLVPRAIARGAVICTPSRAVAQEVQRTYGLAADRVFPTPLGVDPLWFAPPPGPAEPAAPPEAPYVLAVGTLEPRKNLATLVAAYRLAGARGTHLPRLVIVGPPGWGEALDTTGLPSDQIDRAGHVGFDQLRAIVAGAQALVFPSVYEGFGLPPLEALACGTAVIASDLPVTREVLGDQACFVDATSGETLLSGLVQALARPVGTPESRRRHARGFTWQACAHATLAAYRRALDG